MPSLILYITNQEKYGTILNSTDGFLLNTNNYELFNFVKSNINYACAFIVFINWQYACVSFYGFLELNCIEELD